MSIPRAPIARLGCTLPQVFFEARSRYGTYDALHRPLGVGWETITSDELREPLTYQLVYRRGRPGS